MSSTGSRTSRTAPPGVTTAGPRARWSWAAWSRVLVLLVALTLPAGLTGAQAGAAPTGQAGVAFEYDAHYATAPTGRRAHRPAAPPRPSPRPPERTVTPSRPGPPALAGSARTALREPAPAVLRSVILRC